MIISHSVDGDILRVTIHRDLDITNRAAVARALPALVQAHRPTRVLVDGPLTEPSPATLSALVRTHHICRNVGVDFVLTGLGADAQRLLDASVS
ncbi:STAS domain-containing protein [Streptomyces sp. NPDC017254]|uniref:STAS domain-containing protein n=1 Tax=unclassified Streptomyces TaxID=2593676 RepID=UPI0037903F3B